MSEIFFGFSEPTFLRENRMSETVFVCNLFQEITFQEIPVGIISVWTDRAFPGLIHAARRHSAKMELTRHLYVVS